MLRNPRLRLVNVGRMLRGGSVVSDICSNANAWPRQQSTRLFGMQLLPTSALSPTLPPSLSFLTQVAGCALTAKTVVRHCGDSFCDAPCVKRQSITLRQRQLFSLTLLISLLVCDDVLRDNPGNMAANKRRGLRIDCGCPRRLFTFEAWGFATASGGGQ